MNIKSLLQMDSALLRMFLDQKFIRVEIPSRFGVAFPGWQYAEGAIMTIAYKKSGIITINENIMLFKESPTEVASETFVDAHPMGNYARECWSQVYRNVIYLFM